MKRRREIGLSLGARAKCHANGTNPGKPYRFYNELINASASTSVNSPSVLFFNIPVSAALISSSSRMLAALFIDDEGRRVPSAVRPFREKLANVSIDKNRNTSIRARVLRLQWPDLTWTERKKRGGDGRTLRMHHPRRSVEKSSRTLDKSEKHFLQLFFQRNRLFKSHRFGSSLAFSARARRSLNAAPPNRRVRFNVGSVMDDHAGIERSRGMRDSAKLPSRSRHVPAKRAARPAPSGIIPEELPALTDR